MKFYILLAISVFAGCSKTSGCPIEVTTKEPKYGTNGTFGEVYVLSLSSTSGKISCLWRFSSPKNYLLNLLFINITTRGTPSGSGCSDNYALIKTYDAASLSSTALDPYCRERKLPGIRIDGTIEIELHDNGNLSNSGGISFAVFVESSSKHCGGIYNHSFYGLPVSYHSSLAPRNEITHCVWFFEFQKSTSLSVIVSNFSLQHDFANNCSDTTEYLAMRSWNRSNWENYQERRECNSQNVAVNLPTRNHFAITVHSERPFPSIKLNAVCFPVTEGLSNTFLSINGKGSKSYQDVFLHNNSRVEALLVLKPKYKEDQLFFALTQGKQLCNTGTAEIWSEQDNVFRRNSSLCSSPNNDLHSVYNFQDTAFLYFKSTASQLKELKIWFYSSNKGCGGLFKLLPGQSVVVKPPNDSKGYDHRGANCRWVFLAESKLGIDITLKEIDRRFCLFFPRTDIYFGFRQQQFYWLSVKDLCEFNENGFALTGDTEIIFRDDFFSSLHAFKLVVEACGGTYAVSNGNSRTITTPGLKSRLHSADTYCQWNFIVSNATTLVIDINKMNIGKFENRLEGYVEIYKGVYSAKIKQHRLLSKPKAYILLDGNATVIFRYNRSHFAPPYAYESLSGFRMVLFAVLGTKYKSCSEALSANRDSKGRYLLQVDSEIVVVHCEQRGSHVITIIMHRDANKRVPFSFSGLHNITFDYVQNISSIAKVIDGSDRCIQEANKECDSPKSESVMIKYHSWLTNRKNERMSYWAGGPSNGTGCACGITKTCASQYEKCNCDGYGVHERWYNRTKKNDDGLITRKSDLPLTSFRTLVWQAVSVGNVVCFSACYKTYALSRGQSKMITSRQYKQYLPNENCQWNFRTSNLTVFAIAINVLNLEEGDETCRNDYVAIYKVVNSSEIMEHKLCSKPKKYLLINGNMTIKFRSNGHTEGIGFKMEIFAVVGNKYKSCSDALLANRNITGHYLLQIDSEIVVLICEQRLTDVLTIITHKDSDKQFYVSKIDGGERYKKTFDYMQNISDIAKVIDGSDRCFQAVNYTCSHSMISHNSWSWLTNRKKQRMSYWAGGPSNGTGCACGITKTCASKYEKCNCDIFDSAIRYDYGLVTKKSDLPLTSLLTRIWSFGNKNFTVGNVVCLSAKTKYESIESTVTPIGSTVTTTKNKTDVIGKKETSTSSSTTIYAISSALGALLVISIVIVIVIIKRRLMNSSGRSNDVIAEPNNESGMPLVEIKDDNN